MKRKQLCILACSLTLAAASLAVGGYFIYRDDSFSMKESFISQKVLKEFGVEDIKAPIQTHQLSDKDRYVCQVESKVYYYSYVREVFDYLSNKDNIENTFFQIDQSYSNETSLRTIHRRFLYHSDDIYDYSINENDLELNRNYNFYYTLKDDSTNIYRMALTYEYLTFGSFSEDYGTERAMTISLRKYEFFYLDSSLKQDGLEYLRYENYIILSDVDVEKVTVTSSNFEEYFSIADDRLISNNETMIIDYTLKNKHQSYCNVELKIDVRYGNDSISKIKHLNSWLLSGRFEFTYEALTTGSVNISLVNDGFLYLYNPLQNHVSNTNN